MFHFEVTDEADLATPNTARVEPTGGENFNLGDRIHDPDKFSGIVKYVGAVDKQTGTWLGIEWDVHSRGKHNGKLGDKEYFTCSIPNAGSFIKVHKAKKILSLKEALVLRYGHDEAVSSTLKSIEDRLERKTISYSQLRTLNLSSKGIIDSPEDVQEILTLCPDVQVLELAENLIRSWSFIGSLCAGFSKLSRVDFSKNPLTEITDKELQHNKGAFKNVDHVILGSIGYDWRSFLRLSVLWPSVSNLQVPFNLISSVVPPTVTLLNVTSLDLEGNKIVCWNEVLKFTVLQKLEYINLCGNKLKVIRFPAETDQVDTRNSSFFPNLKKLNLTENSIDDWISVSELNKLKQLEELRLDLNPFMNKDTRASNRQMIIARIGKLKKLEGVDIQRQERRDSELDYVKRFSDQWHAEKDSFRFAAENPRYMELIEKWGQSEAGETSTVVKTMKSSLINVTLVPQISSLKPCSKKVVPTMTVQKLKAFVQRVYKENEPPTKITAVSSRNPGITFSLDDDFMDLATYSVEEGDKLIIVW
ncbi:Tubulin-specific chaperone E [Orchesella cincta]|uniref:Leucine-rich repeat-containing protein 51 n=1 Tax=Orchesella cincta TaxID=48709 RepID=A0A1D2N6J0_ORCCI|nr:Tubulin-specific chaperone E [Orchesella cincta]